MRANRVLWRQFTRGKGLIPMSATTVFIIRHGEKPGKNGNGGFDAEGEPDPASLIARGWQRAGAWAALFGGGTGGGDYPTPGVLYATKPTGKSQRPLQTITPLAERLHLSPHRDVEENDGEGLAARVAALTGVVLICWEHKNIVATVLPALLEAQKPPNAPIKWDGDRFDVVLRLDRAVPGSLWSFRQMFPRLLAGDSDIPL